MVPQGKPCILSCVYTRIEVYTSLPGWLSGVKPEPNGQVVIVRPECKATIKINLRGLPVPPSQQFTTWNGLVIPSTAGVRTDDYTGERDLLHLSVRAFGADTGGEYDAVCPTCNKREGRVRGIPSLVDFHAPSDVIRASKDGLVRVKLQFSCYPKHQHPKESAYLWVESSTSVFILNIDCRLEVALSEKNPQGQTSHLATCRLPWHFKVGKRLRPAYTARTRAPAGGIVPPWNGVENPCDQRPVTGDTLVPPACPEAMRRVPTTNVAVPIVQPSPPSSLPDGEHRIISHRQTKTTHLPSNSTVSNKRRWDEAALYDGDAPPMTTGRQVRPRLDSMDSCGTGSQLNGTRPNTPPRCSTTASIAHEANLTLRRPNPTERSPARPTVHVPSTVPSTLSSESTVEPSDNHASHSQRHISPDTRESGTTEAGAVGLTLQSTNPDTGPVAGGIPIWLSVLNLPTEFPLFVRFGTNVTATVSPQECSLSPILNLLVGGRKSQHVVLQTPFYDHFWSCACYTISLPFSQSTTVWSQHS